MGNINTAPPLSRPPPPPPPGLHHPTSPSPPQTLPPDHHPRPPLLHRRLRHVRRPGRRHDQRVREPTHGRRIPHPLPRHHPLRTHHQRPHPHPPFIRPADDEGRGPEGVGEGVD